MGLTPFYFQASTHNKCHPTINNKSKKKLIKRIKKCIATSSSSTFYLEKLATLLSTILLKHITISKLKDIELLDITTHLLINTLYERERDEMNHRNQLLLLIPQIVNLML